MTWRASFVLVALIAACGGSSDGIGGTAGSGGTGGEPAPEPKSCVTTEDCDPGFVCSEFENDDNFVCIDPGTLIDPCTDVREENVGTEDHLRVERGVVPVEPGEVILITTCYYYDIVDSEELEPGMLPQWADACLTFRAEDGGPNDHNHGELKNEGVVKVLCRYQDSPGNEYGIRENYYSKEGGEA